MLLTSIMLAFMVVVPGWAWHRGPGLLWQRGLAAAGVGFVLNLAASWLLAEAGLFRLPALGLVLALFTLAGLWVNRRNGLLPGGLVVALLAVAGLALVVLGLAGRSEWLAGGWDPGIYVNEGLLLERTGSWRPALEPQLARLGSKVLNWLCTAFATHREWFPGIPIDTASAALQPSFARLTSVTAGWLALTGGVEAAVRLPLFMGCAAVLAWGWAFTRWWGPRSAWGLAVLLLHPVFVYHLQAPSSEMTELFLAGVLAAGWLDRPWKGRHLVWMASVLLLASVNRLSFPLFGAILLLARASGDAAREDRNSVLREHAAMAAALCVGMVYHHLAVPIAVAKLAHVLPRIEALVVCTCAGLLAVDVALCTPRGLARTAWLRAAVGRWVWPTGVGLFAVWIACGSSGEWRVNSGALVAYTGWIPIALAVVGGLMLARDRATSAPALFAWGLALCALIVLNEKHAAELYPWASKRWLPFLLPLVALGAASLAVRLTGPVLRGLFIVAMAGSLVASWPLLRTAWASAEYVGVSARIEEAAGHMPDDALVVADHFLWATPLALVHGRPVVNGLRLWKDPSAPGAAMVWEQLAAEAARGTPVLLFTTTEKGAALFGSAADGARIIWEEALCYDEQVHSPRNRGFPLRAKEKTWRLYRWMPTP